MDQEGAIRRAAVVSAPAVALAVTHRAGCPFEQAGLVLWAPFRGYLYATSTGLLLIPTYTTPPFARILLDSAIREARSYTLIIPCSGGNRTNVAKGRGLLSTTPPQWTTPIMPWVDTDGQRWRSLPSSNAGRHLRRRRITLAPSVRWPPVAQWDAGRVHAGRCLTGSLA